MPLASSLATRGHRKLRGAHNDTGSSPTNTSSGYHEIRGRNGAA